MAGLKYFTGNRLDLLAENFSENMLKNPILPLESEVVVVQSKGMNKWLSIELAQRLGVWSNFRYLFPNKIVEEILSSVMGYSPGERFFDKEVMAWNIMSFLPELINSKDFSLISNYLNGELNGLKAWQLSSGIVDTFDQYLTFRPEMILAWDRNEFYSLDSERKDENWQREIWKKLVEESSGKHPPAILEEFYAKINEDSACNSCKLSKRITVFGISYLPLYHFNVLRGISKFIDVSFYLFNPSREYWFDIKNDKEIKKITLAQPLRSSERPWDELHLERGNPLLASLGRSGRDFHHYLLANEDAYAEEDGFVEPRGNSLLAMVQRDVYNMVDRGEGDIEPIPLCEEFLTGDLSLRINSCHSVLREIEVLRDFILGLFDLHDDLEPGDILVMTTDIEKYSPYIGAVFWENGEGDVKIPVSIVDRSLRNIHRSVETLFNILDLEGNRFSAESVFSVLSSKEFSRKFDFSSDDIDKMERWIFQTGIRWGIDGEYKKFFDLPSIDENTWKWAGERMVLGSMMPPVHEPVMGILPAEGVEGSDCGLIGRMLYCVELLAEVCFFVREEHSLSDWCDFLDSLVKDFFPVDREDVAVYDEIFGAIDGLRRSGDRSSFRGMVPLIVVSNYLEAVLDSSKNFGDFISGRITFCETLPMRSIPYRVICMLGMNSADFPRKSRPPAFDLTRAHKVRGDRSIRDEDRYLFLETIMSAGEHLYISYVGQSIVDNTERTPSIVVNELLDYIDSAFSLSNEGRAEDENFIIEVAEEGRVSNFIHRKQKLNAHSNFYFNEENPRSYSAENMSIARILSERRSRGRDFLQGSLPELTDDERHIAVENLVKCLINPGEYLMKFRLGINYDISTELFNNQETVNLSFLEEYQVNADILRGLEKSRNRDEIFELLRHGGKLPHGVYGYAVFNRKFNEVQAFYERVSRFRSKKVEDVFLDFELPEDSPKDSSEGSSANSKKFIISRKFTELYDEGNVHVRYAKFKGKDLLRTWIEHLVLSIASPSGFSGESFLFMQERSIKFESINREIAAKEMLKLLGLYERSMTEAVPLFKRSSFAYALKFYEFSGKGDRVENAKKEARGKFFDSKNFQTNEIIPGDESDSYVAKIFPHFIAGDFPNKKFEDASLELYDSIFKYMEEVLLDGK